MKIRAVCVPLNYRLRGREIEYIIDNSDARAIFCGGEFVPEIAALMDGFRGIVPGGYVVVGDARDPRFAGYEDLIAKASASDPEVVVIATPSSMISEAMQREKASSAAFEAT